MNYQVVKKSSNSKVGKIPVTNSHSGTCPKSCPMITKGCYARAGYYTRLNWDKIDAGERGGSWADLCDTIADLKAGQLWRHNVSGDLPHINETIDMWKLVELIHANKGKRGFTYTHHDMENKVNREAVQVANREGFTVNLSGNNPAHADTLADLGIAPVVTVLPADQLENTVTPAGRKIVVCPAVTKTDVSCESCQLCQRVDRAAIIGFPAHGSQKKAIKFD